MEAPPELPLDSDPVMVDRIEQLQKQFRDAGVGHIHVSSAMPYSAKEAADPALTPVPMEVPSELTPELPLDRASHVIERVDKLQQQFRDASSSDATAGDSVAGDTTFSPSVTDSKILCPNYSCRYKGTGKWMKAHGNKAGNGIVAMMVGGGIMLALLTTHPVAWLSLLVFFCIPVKYRKKIWKDIRSVATGKSKGALPFMWGAILLSFSAPSLFGIFFLSLSSLWIISWGFRNLKAGGSVRLCCPKCNTPVRRR